MEQEARAKRAREALLARHAMHATSHRSVPATPDNGAAAAASATAAHTPALQKAPRLEAAADPSKLDRVREVLRLRHAGGAAPPAAVPQPEIMAAEEQAVERLAACVLETRTRS